MSKKYPFINRELSWLSFNQRVLQEAADPQVPLLERLRFLGIFSNNQDEFFRVRVATVKRLSELGKKANTLLQGKPRKVLEEVHDEVVRQGKLFDAIYTEVQQALKKNGIHIINETQLSKQQGAFVNKYFDEHVRPALVPIMLNQVKQFPYLRDKVIYLAIKLTGSHKKQYALVEVPAETTPRFVTLPSQNKQQYIILLDDIIRYNLPEVFSTFQFSKIEAFTIKVTRDAELDIDNDISQSFIDKISKGVKARQKGNPVRFVYDNHIAKDLLDFLKSKMKLDDLNNLIPGGRYHNFKDFMNFPVVGATDLLYDKHVPLVHPLLPINKSYFPVLRRQDVMLHYPYQQFSHFIELLREAAIDPDVKSIKMTLYRVARNSKVINALINAAKNGKQVTTVVEVQARFDEEANIRWAKKLQEEGIHVIYGVPGLKVHSKLCLITRLENGKPVRYANITTGNYNESTSQVYADDALLTADPRLTNEVEHIFEFFERNYKVHAFKHFILSPLSTRKRLLKLIDAEAETARKGKPARIFLKMNSLVDEEMITHLYEAGQAGVKINIIVRGICALVPGLPGISDNIEAISIIDKYLEHSRIFIFENDGDPLYYFSSADWMTRNLDHRIEATCPIYDKKIQRELLDMMQIQWSDNVKARILNGEQKNMHRTATGTKRVRAQEAIYAYFKKHSERKA
ncbi:MAG: polyphosphate kinase 1 [Bacteroidetes bacterium]|nr:polyphosphate kinase 1 [Bacteroidota bacterium]